MRTLKKTLALVLVVAMMMSLCITSNAAFTDADEIEYVEAVEVMTAIGVIEGFPAGDFQPQGSLTRAQAAKILVYLLGAENEALADGQIFDDVKENHWAADYIAYCAENGLVNGYGDGKFGPEDKLTGYQWAKMLLAALGVDTTEMIGAAWQIPVATAAAKYNIFAENEMADKTEICSREEACLYALNAAKIGVSIKYAVVLNGKEVGLYGTMTEASLAAIALGPQYDVEKKVTDASLLYTMHGVIYDSYQDAWGRPGVSYSNRYWAAPLVYLDTPDAVYTTATTECDIATDLGLRGDNWYVMYTNGKLNATDYEVQPTDTVQKIGAQGTLVEVYGKDIIVVIDTFLAKVTDVTPVAYDKAGHVKAPATITLAVYGATGEANPQTVIDYSYADYTYAKGDYVLINAYTNNDPDDKTGEVEVCDIMVDRDNYAKCIDILGLADTMVGAQTFLWSNAARHTIEGKDYFDAKWFVLDEADYNTAKYTWYFDQYGNLIGSTEIKATYGYGIIEDIQWINPTGASGYAQATIRYMDGTTDTKVIAAIEGLPTAYAGNYGKGQIQSKAVAVSTNIDNNVGLCGNHLYRIQTLWNGTLSLTHVATYEDGKRVSDNELANAVIKTSISGINGKVYTNADTMYLLQLEDNYGQIYYEAITGYDKVYSYTQTPAVIDWVNLDADVYAEYVYVIGEPDSAKSSSLFFRTEASVKLIPDGYGNIAAVEVTGILDGVEDQTIVVVYSELADLGMNQLVAVNFVNGFGVAVDPAPYDNGDGNTKAKLAALGGQYAKLKLAFYDDVTADLNGTVLNIGSDYYTAIELKPEFGSWTDLKNKDIYVVYDDSTGVAIAKAVYIVSQGEGSEDSGAGAPAIAATLELTNNNGTFTATLTEGSTALSGVVVYYQVSNNSGVWSTPATMTYTTGVAGDYYKYDATISMAGTGSYEVFAYAVMNGNIIAVADFVVVK